MRITKVDLAERERRPLHAMYDMSQIAYYCKNMHSNVVIQFVLSGLKKV